MCEDFYKRIDLLHKKYKVAIYPAVSNDGIGTYIKSINNYLNVSLLLSSIKPLSIRFFLTKIPKGYDVIHFPHFVVPLFTGKAIIICTIQDVTPLSNVSGLSVVKKIYLKFRINWSIKKAHHLIFTSISSYKDTVSIFGNLSVGYSIIPLGVNPIDLSSNGTNPCSFEYFLCVGRRRHHKNTARIIQAFKNVESKTSAHLIFAGGRDLYDKEYKQLINSLGLENKVHFIGYVPEGKMEKYYLNAISLVYPSLCEGFGLPILEAMSCECPVITSNTSSMPEVSGDAAILIDPFDVCSISDAMLMIYNNSSLRSELILKGKNRSSDFSWLKTSYSTLCVYENITAG